MCIISFQDGKEQLWPFRDLSEYEVYTPIENGSSSNPTSHRFCLKVKLNTIFQYIFSIATKNSRFPGKLLDFHISPCFQPKDKIFPIFNFFPFQKSVKNQKKNKIFKITYKNLDTIHEMQCYWSKTRVLISNIYIAKQIRHHTLYGFEPPFQITEQPVYKHSNQY